MSLTKAPRANRACAGDAVAAAAAATAIAAATGWVGRRLSTAVERRRLRWRADHGASAAARTARASVVDRLRVAGPADLPFSTLRPQLGAVRAGWCAA